MSAFTHCRLEVPAEGIVLLRFCRPDKRNAVNEGLIADLAHAVDAPPDGTRVLILAAEGDHFCAGLDLAEHVQRDAFSALKHSRRWHEVLNRLQFGGLPVVSALKGAVIGGGLEIATATHVRLADPSAFYQLPEGRRGIFVGGGASVRVGRILGPDRMTEMMLTGRRLDAETGQALGLSHELVAPEALEARALALAQSIAGNAPVSNYMMIQAVARIGEMAAEPGLFTESLATALAQTSPEAEAGLRAFLDKRNITF